MRLRTLSTLLSDVLSHLPGAEYERAKCEALAAQVQEQRSHIEDLARRLEYTTRQKDEAEERESSAVKAHDEALGAACEVVKVVCDNAKASYEAEKVAHGETQRHLTTAIAERDEARHDCESQRLARVKALRDFNDAIAERNAAEAERDALRARVAELQSGEPVMHAVSVQGRIVASFVTCETAERMAKGSYCEYSIEPLFRSQPAAPVVGGEPVAWLFEFANGRRCYDSFREHAEAAAKNPDVTRVVPLYAAPQPAAPVVDVAKIRDALKTLRSVRIWTGGDLQIAADAFAAIAAAIGEEA